ncbi:4916_t:CDS:1, partial [Dentiscutata erythropus]
LKISTLAFLPPNEIPAALSAIKNGMPDEANNLVNWFEENYVLGRERHSRGRPIIRNGIILRNNLLFPPELWSITDNIEHALPRTQNSVESWHRR